jgi:hypothetical protein
MFTFLPLFVPNGLAENMGSTNVRIMVNSYKRRDDEDVKHNDEHVKRDPVATANRLVSFALSPRLAGAIPYSRDVVVPRCIEDPIHPCGTLFILNHSILWVPKERRWACARSTGAKDSDLALIGLRTRVSAVMP